VLSSGGRDDAIVVLENAQRRADSAPAPLAAIRGTRQVAFAVIATTAVLIAVFVPMAFQEATMALFRELAVGPGRGRGYFRVRGADADADDVLAADQAAQADASASAPGSIAA